MIQRVLVIAAVALAVLGLGAAPAAAADSGILVSTGQNLPPLSVTSTYSAGPGFADQIRAYQESGAWPRERARVAGEAQRYLRTWLASTCGSTCRPAVVFDIDDTLVSWYPIWSTTNFTTNPVVFAQNATQCLTPKIRSTAALFEQARRAKVDIFLITGRDDSARAITVSCLKQLGLVGYRELIMRAPDQAAQTAKAYKSAARRGIEERGWRIALAIGDQVSDSSGGYTDARFVLPNPMYFIP